MTEESDPLFEDAEQALRTILMDQELIDKILRIFKTVVREAEIMDEEPQWREDGHFFY